MLTTEELAARWKLQPNTLVIWRMQCAGPKYVKVGARVLYRLEDVEAFERANEKNNGDIKDHVDELELARRRM